MRVKYRFTFREDEASEAIEYLNSNNVRYRTSKGIPLITIEMFEDDILWDKFKYIMDKYEVTSLKEAIYTDEEFLNSKWLRVRSKYRWEYPQPDNAFEFRRITYNDETFCGKCGCGLIQKGYFKVKKSPQWGNRNFLMLNWIEDELFINNKVASVLIQNNLQGFQIYSVLGKSNDIMIPEMKQIYVNETIMPGIVNKNDTIFRENICISCGCKKYILSGKGIFYKQECFFDITSDIVKSSELFGDGHMSARMIFVSKRFYNIMKENYLDKDLVFEPVLMI